MTNPQIITVIDLDTGEVLSSFEAQNIPGIVYDRPEHILTPPPETAPGTAPRWTGTAWQVLEDHRGQTVYGGDDGRTPITIDRLGPRSDFGTEEPAAASQDEVAAQLQAAIAVKVGQARAEQYARQAVSFWYTSPDNLVINAHVRCAEIDEQSLNTFALLIQIPEDQWDGAASWVAAEPTYDAVALPTAQLAKAFAIAMTLHMKVWKEAFLSLMSQIQTAQDLAAVEAIDVTADAHWPNIQEPST